MTWTTDGSGPWREAEAWDRIEPVAESGERLSFPPPHK